jgi:TRAP-type C4-dicarboxylate transport system substrate-binding protein
MLEPLLMSKSVFDGLPKDQQDAILSIGAELEPFGIRGAQTDDVAVETIFAKAGAKVQTLDDATLESWRRLSREAAWKDFSDRSASCADLLKLAEAVA